MRSGTGAGEALEGGAAGAVDGRNGSWSTGAMIQTSVITAGIDGATAIIGIATAVMAQRLLQQPWARAVRGIAEQQSEKAKRTAAAAEQATKRCCHDDLLLTACTVSPRSAAAL
jgi:hypothetical protein